MAQLVTVIRRRAIRPVTFRGKRYRKGQYLPKGARFGSIERYIQRRADTGRILATLEVISEKTVVKTVTPELMEATQGHIGEALSITNVLSRRSLINAKFIEIKIKAKDFRDKLHRFAVQIDVEHERQLNSLLIGRIVEKLHEQRFRPEYPLNIVDWRDTKVSRSYAQKMRQLHDMQIIVRIRK